ncbi:hypothetical protein Pint_10180 [Pistacia integerrima]|uniref:Uncharacterized protein n=1 Tax=Pistacia integerrima TaxID=434235 RepID=A0ACC0XHZ9_9ROSI|nr:hypothetical protein Pint_10180 [Pistacia integerrima]
MVYTFGYSDLSCNYLNGTLPMQWASMQHLNKIRISDNNFAGTIPEFIGGWTSLQRLEMHSSGLEGPIPHSLFGLGNLSDLNLGNEQPACTSDLTLNNLEGEISSTEVHPNFIFLSDNMVPGNIPDSFLTSTGSYMYVPKLIAWIPYLDA